MATGNFKRIIILLAFLLVSGCATLYNPATGKKEIILIDTETEVGLGKSAVGELNKRYRISGNIELQNRAKIIGKKVASVSDRQDIEYKFSVLKDDSLNAMTLPGGFIYINEGLIKILNDDELAYVLGHEAGHVAARHIVKKIQSNMAYQLILSLAFAGVGEKGATPTAQNVAGGIDTVFNLIELGYSRQDEYEADRLGAKYAYKGGFDPYASLSALEKIKKESADLKILQYFRTHPYVEDRIEALKQVLPQLTGK